MSIQATASNPGRVNDYAAKQRVIDARGAASPVTAATSSSNEESASVDPPYVLELSSQAKELSKQALEKHFVETTNQNINDQVVGFEQLPAGESISTVTKMGSTLAFKYGIDNADRKFILADITAIDGKRFSVKIDTNTVINENKDGTLSIRAFSGLSGSENDIIIDFSGDVDSGAGDDFIISVADKNTLRRKDRVSIDTGAGHDVVYSLTDVGHVTIHGGTGNDYINTTAGNAKLDVDSGDGHDFVKVNDVGTRASIVTAAGEDSVSVTTDSGAELTIDTGSDNDSVEIKRTEAKEATIGHTTVRLGAGADFLHANRIGSQSDIPKKKGDPEGEGGFVSGGEGEDTVIVDVAYNLKTEEVEKLIVVERHETPQEFKEVKAELAEFDGTIPENGDYRAQRAKVVKEAMEQHADENTAELIATGSKIQKVNNAAAKALHKATEE